MPEFTFDHVHLFSTDPAKTAEFYKGNFGAEDLGLRDLGAGRVIARLKLGGIPLLISKPGPGQQAGLAHFGIRTDNLDSAAAGLKSKGIPFTRDPMEIAPGLKISFLNAPEGVPIELQEGSV